MATIPIPDPTMSIEALRSARDRLIELADTELRLGRLRLKGEDPSLAQRSFRLALAASEIARSIHRLISAHAHRSDGTASTAPGAAGRGEVTSPERTIPPA